MHKLSTRLTVIGLMALFLALAVGGQVAAQGDTVPAATAVPNFPITLKEGLTLDNEHSSETIETPKLTIEVDKPVLKGDAALVDAFNTAADKIIEDTAGSFKSDTLTYQTGSDLPPDIAALGSYIGVGYQFFTPTDSLLSISFGVNWYSAGAAHPNSYSRTLNYNLTAGKVLALADLFKSDAQYLEAVSAYSIKVLTEKGTLMFPDGAQATDDNYKNWNLTPDGLLITFDDYQVAPHVAGPQQVVIPYAELTDLIDPDGVLGPLVTRG
ncbi:MAG: RsiV family protein [Chloroflexota bacterium]